VILVILLVERESAHLDIAALRGLAFLAMACMGQVAILALRERDAIFRQRPSVFLVGSAAFAIIVASWMAIRGMLMPPLPPVVVGETLAAVFAWGIVLLVLKLPIYRLFLVGRESHPIGLSQAPRIEERN
jgi:amino acid transporter